MREFVMGALLLALLLAGQGRPAMAATAGGDPFAAAWEAYNIGRYADALRLALPLASDGDARAQVLVAGCHENGLGVPQDFVTAAKWLSIAAENGYAEAQMKLASLYGLGAGVPRDAQQEAAWMTRAAQGGNAEAQHTLAMWYAQGSHGQAKDAVAAFTWAGKAAAQDYGPAELFVAACYEHGFGVEKDEAQANAWYARAAQHGLTPQAGVIAVVRAPALPVN